MITIVGLGPATLDQLPPLARTALASAGQLILRTARHPAAEELRRAGVALATLDDEYERATSFAELYPRLAERVLAAAAFGDVVYAVPGHPLVAEASVQCLLEAARARGIPVRVLPAPSFADAAIAALANAGVAIDASNLRLADATAIDQATWDVGLPVLVHQVDDRLVASRVKLALLEEYPADHAVHLVRNAGVAGEEAVLTLPLAEVDHPRAGQYDHLTALYVPPLPRDRRRPRFDDFVALIARLRAPDGCPWDREQTPTTLKRYIIEEVYEVLEAVDDGDPDRLRDELGDLMILILMYAQMAREEGHFDIRDVIAGVVAKLIRRHPHVFGDVTVANSAEVLRNWEAIKRRERPERASLLDGVPRSLPALLLALEVSRRVAKVGFEWPDVDGVLAKIHEEATELQAELATRDPERLREEIGDLLFTVVNLARWLEIDPEEALRAMVARFSRRFRAVEAMAAAEGRPLAGMTIDELDALWERAKERLA